MFVEDYDMFAERMKMTYQQIIDTFDEYLDDKDKKFLETYYAQHSSTDASYITYADYYSYYPDICNKFTETERSLYNKSPYLVRD